MINKSRVEAFSDGVLAIVATILVLELVLPTGPSITDFAVQWPVLLAFVVSFFQIYLTWYNHNRLFAKLKCINKHVFILNGFWLLFACLVPFTVSYLGTYPNTMIPTLVYLVNLFLWALSFHILDHVAIKESANCPKDTKTDVFMRIFYYVFSKVRIFGNLKIILFYLFNELNYQKSSFFY